MCNPTYAALLTGMCQNRPGEKFEGPLNGKIQFAEGMPEDVTTLAEMLKTEGCKTGVFGKWHLGYQQPFLPSNQGFDKFIGLGSGEGVIIPLSIYGAAKIGKTTANQQWKGAMASILLRAMSRLLAKPTGKTVFSLYIAFGHLFSLARPNEPAHRKQGVSYEDDK